MVKRALMFFPFEWMSDGYECRIGGHMAFVRLTSGQAASTMTSNLMIMKDTFQVSEKTLHTEVMKR